MISRIYEELTTRYNRISVSTIKSVLKGKMKVRPSRASFKADNKTMPRMEEAEDAFKKFNCAIFTAFRGCYSLDENKGRNALLRADLEAMGMNFCPVTGCYREADWEDPCVENCFFVVDNNADGYSFFEQIYHLSAKYDQDSFLYKRAGINRTAFLVATTEAGRADLKGDIKFAGQLHLDVPNIEAWTDCAEGKRFAFQLKGMILFGTDNPKIKIGEGDIFDIADEQYCPDGIAVVREKHQEDLKEMCKAYDGGIPLVERYIAKEAPTADDICAKVRQSLNELAKQKCKSIGFHCSVALEGSYVEGARVALDTVKEWAHRNDKKLKRIVIVDIYGDYSKVLNKQQ